MRKLKGKLCKFLFCKLVFLCCVSGASYAGTIHVPEDYSTIKAAVSNASSGDVIIIAPGTYRENGININKKLTITSQYYTTKDTKYINQTVIDGGRSTVFETINGKGVNVEISGLKFTNASKPIIVNDLVTIKNNIFSDNGGDAISFESDGYGYVGYNTIENTSDDGIDVDGRKGYYTIEHNMILNNEDDGIEIRLYKYSGPTVKYTINNNTLSGNGEDGIQLIDYSDVSDRVFSIFNNVIVNNAMAGVGCMPDGNTRENYGGSSMKERAYLYHNTIAGNVVGVTGADNMIALNNIIANNKKEGIKRFKTDSVVGYSIFYNNGLHIKDCITADGIWENVNPKYDSNYHLLDGSPCIDKGTAYFVWHSDVVLNIPSSSYKGSSPDLGAKESGSSTEPPKNQPPTVNAGSLEVIYDPTDYLTLGGQVSDDGLPDDTLETLWSMVSGPGTVTFSDPRDTDATVTFSKQGTYKLKLTANDGELETSDTITVRYVEDGDGDTVTIAAPNTVPFEAEKYAWLVGTAKKVSDIDASGGTTITAPEGMGDWAYTEYSLIVTEENYPYYVWIRAKGSDDSSDSLSVSLNGDSKIAVTTSSNGTYSWVKLPKSLSTPPGNYPLVIGAVEDGVTWDKVIITTDPAYDPRSIVTTIYALDISIAQGDDDVEEKNSGGMRMSSSDIELVVDSGIIQNIGLRFNSLNIPSGAIITKAYIQFTTDEISFDETTLMIKGETSNNAMPFVGRKGNVSSRSRTVAKVSWNPPAWDIKGESGQDQQTPDITSIVQEIINQPGWAANNAMVFIISGTGRRIAESFEGATNHRDLNKAPKLHIEYSKMQDFSL
ncbi:MAG: right-handed parallel beta-helix repeat-containing protein [Candidatus Jettenia sp. CY-1]|nr:MAG: right-handed parallel beta-helix repeat-containing protein [Candidatus Jettenia sp. CY-1]